MQKITAPGLNLLPVDFNSSKYEQYGAHYKHLLGMMRCVSRATSLVLTDQQFDYISIDTRLRDLSTCMADRCKFPWTCHNLTIWTTSFEPIARENEGRPIEKFDKDIFEQASGVFLSEDLDLHTIAPYVPCNDLVIQMGS